MGMFDRYRPEPPLKCPVCQVDLEEWQGKDGPCGLFVWQQNHSAPVDQLIDKDARLDPAALAKKRLPDEFRLYSFDCFTHGRIDAIGRCRGGRWVETEITKCRANRITMP